MELFFVLIILMLLVSFLIPAVSLAPWLPMWKKDLPRVFALAKLQPKQVFYDLGCGDGRTVFYAAKQEPTIKALGIELSLPMFLICQLKRLFSAQKNTKFLLKNALKQNLSDADVVFIYALPDNLKKKVVSKLKQEMKKGSMVISYAFKIEGLEPVIIDKPAQHLLPVNV